jgi:hypothetical protein
MKKIAIIFSMLFNLLITQDNKAVNIFKDNLAIVRERLDKKKFENFRKVNDAIDFLEQVTGITSHSDGNYFGRFDPTELDYKNWSNWFKSNQSKLYWDEQLQKVMVSSSVNKDTVQ